MMVQFRILSGKMAGDTCVVRHFPFCIGRAGGNDLQIQEAGVWDKHLTLKFVKSEGYILEAAPEAFCAINEQPQSSARLRNGDILSFGSAKIQFWLAPAKLRGLKLREAFVWLLLISITLIQIWMLLKLRK